MQSSSSSKSLVWPSWTLFMVLASMCCITMVEGGCAAGFSQDGARRWHGVIASGSQLNVGFGQDRCFFTSGTVSPTPPSSTIGDLSFSVAATNVVDNYWVVMGHIPASTTAPSCAGFTDSYVTQCSSTGVCGGSMHYGNTVLNPIPNGRRPAIKIWCRNSLIQGDCDFKDISNLNVCWDVAQPTVSTSASVPTAPPSLSCSNRASVLALSAQERPSSNLGGFLTTKTLTFCLASSGPVYLSSTSNSNGDLRVDDVLVYQLDSQPIVGLSYSSKCTTSGFLSISEGNIQQVGSRTNGPAVSLGSVTAGQHTLKIGVFDCGGAAGNSVINVVACGLTASCPSSSPGGGSSSAGGGGSSSNSGSSSGTVWSGQYQVTSSCGSGCCCIGGTFSLTQSGTQVTGTVSLTGSCQGQTTAPIAVNLPSATATSVSTTVLGQRTNIFKNGDSVTLDNLDASQCSGTATCTSGDCRSSSSGQSGGAGASAGGGNVCFHESTVIEYQGQRYTMQDLLKGKVEECHVPHVIQSSNSGVIIETDCSSSQQQNLHLTGDHLVYTQGDGGLKAAQDVAVGKVLFADLQQSKHCTVTKVTGVAHSHSKEETYFGLNCVGSSQVLANGIKTSTFGHYHAVPAAWMRVVGQCFGIERASRWGNSLANWWHSHGHALNS